MINEREQQTAHEANAFSAVFETMSGGRVEGRLHSVLQMVGRGRGTRLVAVTHRQGQAVLVLHNGAIRYVVRNGVEERLLNALEMHRQLGHEAIDLARSQQNQAGAPVPLSALLLEQGALSEETLHEALIAVAVADLQEVLSWQHGVYRVIVPSTLGARGEDVLRACATASSVRQRQVLERRLAAVWHERLDPSKSHPTGTETHDLLDDLNDFAFTYDQMAGPMATLTDDGRDAWLACLLPEGLRYLGASGEVATPIAMRDARFSSLLSRLAPRESYRLESIGAWVAPIEVQGEIVGGLVVADGDRPAAPNSLLRVAEWIERMCLRSAEEVSAARFAASWRLLDNWILGFAHAHQLTHFAAGTREQSQPARVLSLPRLVPRQARAMALPRTILRKKVVAEASAAEASAGPAATKVAVHDDDALRPLVYRLP